MMHEQIAIPTRIEVDRVRVIPATGRTISRTDPCERGIGIPRDEALTHYRRKEDEPHGEYAKPRGQSIAAVSDHDVGDGRRSILAEKRCGTEEIAGIP